MPIDPKTGEIVNGNIEQQSIQALTNLVEVLKASNSNVKNVIKTTCHLNDMSDFSSFNKIYCEFFTSDFPARSTFAVKALPKNCLVEIEAIAWKK